VPHGIYSGKCLSCYTSSGRARRAWGPGRPATDNPRAVARRAGDPTYTDQCEVHGPAAHSVTHGKCLTCYTTLGHPRKRLDAKVTWCDLGRELVMIAHQLERDDWRQTILAAATELSR